MNILVIEDDLMTRKIIEKTLQQPGHFVTSSLSAKDALETLKTQDFDVILIDIHMPDMNGIKLIEKIRNELNCITPVAILTRDKAESTVRKAFEAGADDYIIKPFNEHELLERLNKLKNKKKQG